MTGARRADTDTVTLTAVANEKPSSGPQRTPARLVAMAASAGGIHAIGVVLSTLPSDLPAPVVIVQHLAPRHPSHMAAIMTRQTQLDVRQARDGEVLRNGVVYIAPPDRHLLVNTDGSVSLADTELVHFLRPSADLLFESDLWGLRDDEVIGQPLLTQDIGLPVRELASEIRACLAGDTSAERVVSALTRRGRTIRVRVTCTLVRGPRGIEGVVVLTEDISGTHGHEPASTSEQQSAPTS